jgi:hypothetical protein
VIHRRLVIHRCFLIQHTSQNKYAICIVDWDFLGASFYQSLDVEADSRILLEVPYPIKTQPFSRLLLMQVEEYIGPWI